MSTESDDFFVEEWVPPHHVIDVVNESIDKYNFIEFLDEFEKSDPYNTWDYCKKWGPLCVAYGNNGEELIVEGIGSDGYMHHCEFERGIIDQYVLLDDKPNVLIRTPFYIIEYAEFPVIFNSDSMKWVFCNRADKLVPMDIMYHELYYYNDKQVIDCSRLHNYYLAIGSCLYNSDMEHVLDLGSKKIIDNVENWIAIEDYGIIYMMRLVVRKDRTFLEEVKYHCTVIDNTVYMKIDNMWFRFEDWLFNPLERKFSAPFIHPGSDTPIYDEYSYLDAVDGDTDALWNLPDWY